MYAPASRLAFHLIYAHIRCVALPLPHIHLPFTHIHVSNGNGLGPLQWPENCRASGRFWPLLWRCLASHSSSHHRMMVGGGSITICCAKRNCQFLLVDKLLYHQYYLTVYVSNKHLIYTNHRYVCHYLNDR